MSLSRLAPFMFLALGLATSALAKQADRQQPMDVVADQVQSALSDASPTILTGSVKVVQGSMQVAADTGTLHTKDGDIIRAHFTGQPVKLDQQLEDGTPMHAVANTVEYDLATDTVTLVGAVVVEKPTDTLHGERVVYDLRTGAIRADGEGGTGRVTMHILPRPAH